MSASLNITIIGAGLGGLAAARALREHHKVTVVERWEGGNEVGAAINMGPTAVEWLNTVGFSPEKTGSIRATMAQTFTRQGKFLMETDMTKFLINTKADWYLQHRADLFNEFLRLATMPSKQLDIAGEPATIRWATDAVDVDVETGDVRLASGDVIHSDLVIGADGVRSIVRPLVVGDAAFDSARPSGASAFRFTIPIDVLKENNLGDIRMMDRSKPVGLYVHIAMDPTNRSIVIYPCRDFNLLNFVAIVPDSMLENKSVESWSAEGSRDELVECFKDFDEGTLTLLRLATNVKLWQLRDQDPLPSYIKGRTVLIGDAAHAMTPHQGQGGTQAVEDAEALHYLFGSGSITRDDVPRLLADFDRVRRPRASQIQNNTREAHERKDADTLYKHSLYNWSYPGIKKCLENLDAGRPLVQY